MMESVYIKTEDNEIEIQYENYESQVMGTQIKVDVGTEFEVKELEENEVFIKHEEIEIKCEDDEGLESHLKSPRETNEDDNQATLSEDTPDTEDNIPFSDDPLQDAWKCYVCKFEGKDKVDLRNHMTSTHRDPLNLDVFKCSLCEHRTGYLHKLSLHMLAHRNWSVFQLFKPKRKKRDDSSNSQQLRCCLCDFECKGNSSLSEHITSRHKDPSNSNLFKCTACNFETKYIHKLILHTPSHKDPAEAGRYQCHTCEFKSDRKIDLRKHVLSHIRSSDEFWYRCNVCDYKSKYKNYLTNHMLKHKDLSEVKGYECKECNFRTKWKPSFVKHMRVHSKASS